MASEELHLKLLSLLQWLLAQCHLQASLPIQSMLLRQEIQLHPEEYERRDLVYHKPLIWRPAAPNHSLKSSAQEDGQGHNLAGSDYSLATTQQSQPFAAA